MKIHACEQGSPEWHKKRLGMPTASRLAKLVTPAKGELSVQRRILLRQCVAEEITGESCDSASSQLMERGSKHEDAARARYAWDHECVVQRVGFVTNDEETVGGSPDGFVRDDGMIEIKIRELLAHVGYMIAYARGEPVDELALSCRVQVQGLLWICEREWCDVMAYNPGVYDGDNRLWPAYIRVGRDEAFIRKLAAAVEAFTHELHEALEWLGLKEPAKATA